MFSWAQLQNSQWYFGDGAGIDFTGQNPVAHDLNTMNGIPAGSASIADVNGNLLFYCDTMVWNAQHQPMLNGFGLLGNLNSLQPCLILPKPGSNDKLIIVSTPDYWPVNGHVNEAYWSEVDLILDGGFGAVTQKNILLMDSSSGMQAATLHENGTDYWVLTHRMGSDAFAAHLLTSTGFLSNSVYSNIGSYYSEWSYNQGLGWLCFSNNGSKVANAHEKLNEIEIFDFDNSTGLLSDRILLSEPDANGIEFSPNGQFIYCVVSGSINNNPKLLQFDISSGDSAQIAASRTVLYESPSTSTNIMHAVVQAPDSKLYVSIKDADTIGVINDPDLPGLSCNYVHNGFALAPGTFCRFGLPNFTKQYAQVVDAVQEEPTVVDLEVYPVPAQEQFSLDLPTNWNGQQLELQLFDLRGRMVITESFIAQGRTSIDRATLNGGAYQGTVNSNDELRGVFRVVFE